MKRVLIAWAVLAVLALPGAALAAPPTLGALLYPAPFYADGGSTLTVVNRANEPTAYHVTVTGRGWAVSPHAFRLLPGAQQSIAITSVGNGPGTLSVAGKSDRPTLAAQQGVVIVGTQLYPSHPFDPWSLLPAVALAGTALLLAGAFLVSRRISR